MIRHILTILFLLIALIVKAQTEEDKFITVWDTSKKAAGVAASTNKNIAIKARGKNYVVEWENVDDPTINGSEEIASSADNSSYVLSFPSEGVYRLKIYPKAGGFFNRFTTYYNYDKNKLLRVEQWGTIQWNYIGFWNCINLDVTATDTPNLKHLHNNSMNGMFNGCKNLEGNDTFNKWDTSKVTDMSFMFFACSKFNAPIGNWNTSKVKNMQRMFNSATLFNQNINTKTVNKGKANEYIAWDTKNVTSMAEMFKRTKKFNHAIDKWNTSKLTDMAAMFREAKAFNQNINTKIVNAGTANEYIAWDIKNVTSLWHTFDSAKNFNQSLDRWNTSKVTNLRNTFAGTIFNQNINTKKVTLKPGVSYMAWDTKNVTAMFRVFYTNKVFNGNISNWNTSKVTNMGYMFTACHRFNQNISTKEVTVGGNTYIAWDTKNVTNFQAMFMYCLFNQPIGNWNTSKVTNMNSMFYGAGKFNQDISTKQVTVGGNTYIAWDTKNVTRMDIMLEKAYRFNQPIGNWNTSKVKYIERMFWDARSFNQDISTKEVTVGGNTYTAWNVGNAISMKWMFFNARKFNQSLASWDITSVTNMTQMLDLTKLSVENYDSTLIGWAKQNVRKGLSVGARNLRYCLGEAARTSLIANKGWHFYNDNDGGCDKVTEYIINEPQELTATISGDATICETDSAPISIALAGGTPSYLVTYNGTTTEVANSAAATKPPAANYTLHSDAIVAKTVFNSTNITITDQYNCTANIKGSATISIHPKPSKPKLFYIKN